MDAYRHCPVIDRGVRRHAKQGLELHRQYGRLGVTAVLQANAMSGRHLQRSWRQPLERRPLARVEGTAQHLLCIHSLELTGTRHSGQPGGKPFIENAQQAGVVHRRPFLAAPGAEAPDPCLQVAGSLRPRQHGQALVDHPIQQQFGGLYAPEPDPDPVALGLARQVLATVKEELLYARIDLARGADGQWLLMEAELIEPDFYLNHAPDGGQAFVSAVTDRLNR